MSALDPQATTMGDLVNEALKMSGKLALGQAASAEDLTQGWVYIQWMLQQWARKRWHVYRLVQLSLQATGALTYSVGPGGDFSTGTLSNSVRPAKIASAFIRQTSPSLVTPTDWPVGILESKQDYDRIRIKSLSTISSVLWYDPSWPLGTLYFWPIPSNEYALYISVLLQLPPRFLTQAEVINLPLEYYMAIVSNLAMIMRGRWGISTFPGDTVPGMAKSSIAVLYETNVAIPRLEMPGDLGSAGGAYNIFSDQQ